MEYRVLRSRRKTIAIEITLRGDVLVRCPQRLSKREIQHFVDSRRDWILTHLNRLPPQADILSDAEMGELARQAKLLIPPKVRYYSGVLRVNYDRITIRAQRTRWGSCSAAGNLNFNCLLMLAPEDVLDYVIVHELCHRKEMNHSARFWAEVESILPDYRQQRRWLREHGSALLTRLPDPSQK